MNITILTILIVVGIFGIPLLIAFITNLSNDDTDYRTTSHATVDTLDRARSGLRNNDVYNSGFNTPAEDLTPLSVRASRFFGSTGGGRPTHYKYYLYVTVLLISLCKELYL
jgi:hypothetical protein